MFEYIDQLRNRPDTHRRRVAAYVSAGVTGLIAIIWISTISFNSLAKPQSDQVASPVSEFQVLQENLDLENYGNVTGTLRDSNGVQISSPVVPDYSGSQNQNQSQTVSPEVIIQNP